MRFSLSPILFLLFSLSSTFVSGQIGIGTTQPNPLARLHVAGKLLVGDLPGVAFSPQIVAADGTGFLQSLRGSADGDILRWTNNRWELSTLNFTATTPITGVGTTGSPFRLINGNAPGDILQWNGSAWVSIQNNWGSQTVNTGNGLTGEGTLSNPLVLDPQGAALGQVLKWNGTAWTPSTDELGDNWGGQAAAVSDRLRGDGTAANPLDLAQNGATQGQVLKWNGTFWEPNVDNVGVGDNWGTQSVTTSARFSGNGTAANPLEIAQAGAATGQVLKWNGAAWTPAADDNTVYTAGAGITLNGSIIINGSPNATHTGDATGANALTVTGLQNRPVAPTAPATGQVLKWNGTQWSPAAETGTDNWGTQVAQTTARLTGTGTATNPLDLAQNGAANGQVLKWNGTSWAPATDALGWGTQVALTDATLTGDGVTKLGIAQQGANVGQTLKWNGATWLPADDEAGDNWGLQTVQTSGVVTGSGVFSDAVRIANGTLGFPNQTLVWNGANWSVGTLSTPSDRRLKDNIRALNYGLQEVMHLQPVRYLYKQFPESGDNLGFIAQDVQKILPELVAQTNDDAKLLSVKYAELTPVLVKAIQEQQLLIEKQQKQIEELQAKADAAQTQTEQLQALQTQLQNLESRLNDMQRQSQPVQGR